MKVAGDLSQANLVKRLPPLRSTQGSESAPHRGLVPEPETLIDEAAALFGLCYGRTIGREEARQMIERLTAFFAFLDEWHQRSESRLAEGEVAA